MSLRQCGHIENGVVCSGCFDELLNKRSSLESQLRESQKECEEQARLLGMSGSREAKLLAELAAAKAEIATIQQRLSSPRKANQKI